MADGFLHTIFESFVEKGVIVALATHNPSVIANADDRCTLFLKLPNSEKNGALVPTSREEALSMLSEGYMTIDETISFFSNIESDVIFLSEGKNYRYLELANKHFGSSSYHFVKNRNLSNSSLRILYDLGKSINLKKNIVYVWDCDYQKKLSDGDKFNLGYILIKNTSNDIVDRGIENCLPKSYFAQNDVEKIDTGDTKVKDQKKDSVWRKFRDAHSHADLEGFRKLFEIVNSKFGTE